MDEKQIKQATQVYETLCSALDARNWKYTRHDEDLTVTCGARGEDLSMDLIIRVNPKVQVVSLFSPLPFKTAEDKMADMAQAVCVANYGLINGCFDFNRNDGKVIFRLVSSYRGSILSEALFDYMVMVSAGTIDDYNDKLLMLAKGMISLDQFIASEKN